MSEEDWEGVAEEHIPVTCPNCWDDYGEDFPLINASMQDCVRLHLKIVLWGTCIKCGEAVACVYTLVDGQEELEIPHTN